MSHLASEPGALVAAIGVPATIALAEAFGGSTVLVRDQAVIDAIGSDAAEALASAFPFKTIPVPVAREMRADAYRQEGNSIALIAWRLSATEREVTGILRRLDWARRGARHG